MKLRKATSRFPEALEYWPGRDGHFGGCGPSHICSRPEAVLERDLGLGLGHGSSGSSEPRGTSRWWHVHVYSEIVVCASLMPCWFQSEDLLASSSLGTSHRAVCHPKPERECSQDWPTTRWSDEVTRCSRPASGQVLAGPTPGQCTFPDGLQAALDSHIHTPLTVSGIVLFV